MLQKPQDPDLGHPTPLYCASEKGRLGVSCWSSLVRAVGGVHMLVEAKADKHKKMDDGGTPPTLASHEGQLDVVRLLLEANADKDMACASLIGGQG